MARPHTINWQDNKLYLLDQRKLPISVEYKCCETAEDVADAIKSLLVRGAPAIGAAAAYGLVLAALKSTPETIREDLNRAANLLAGTRPTAVNLFWAIEKMMAAAAEEAEYSAICRRLQQKADEIMELDVESNRAIGRFGAELLPDDARIMTICNAGALATADYGTALGVIRAAKEAGKHVTVYALETRPVLQGARLTAWELQRAGIPVTLLCDGAAASLMAQGKVDLVLVGADRVAANGDVANKIGTAALAVAAQAFGVPFYVASPLATIDLSLPSGQEIPIEERDPREVTEPFGVPVAPEGVPVYNPAFDVTPHRFITGIITEKGIVHPPYGPALRALFS